MNGLRYICKATDPAHAFIWRGKRHTLADFDRGQLADIGRPTELMWTHEKQSANRPERSTGISYSIGTKRQTKAGFDRVDPPIEGWLVPTIALDRLLHHCRDLLQKLTSAAANDVASHIDTTATKATVAVFWLDDAAATDALVVGYDGIKSTIIDGMINRRLWSEKNSNNSAIAPP